ncbi:Choline/ethanolaminephosphotransferase 1 [Trichinella pseudospiralis]|uniref:diacylglycerol cholinephosphotransferase n=3 Tax=Trichinella pseudospiralis TaxID=6337 RepID=A0A0V0YKP6_TRIPS|nr:Choline/ethanolaminephosphotransferase 1 [Trichinella pseudospiralis]KRY69937.1 Choline/ethanolaminephosphotransferase 1 [Trichinella pseudospiralis]KRY88730.1 Choline/ethanolaminephosphotransferase 1 [Trichinella pseudospiralis]KRZ21008.1 Choline/ethanolaminephosphotransferase 1 [Trichinella pseudospiralis]KRZ41609.1 Choline/ethanolaminephosphotransferase 1 [Trichinella pseudospiralis]
MFEVFERIITAFKEESMLSQSQLKRLLEHRYCSQDRSILSELFMNNFWNWLVERYPLWIAPNALTFVGLLINVVSTLILAWYSPDAKQTAPFWVYMICALSLFFYQSLDATDGKQARRTETATPLGELFDHGCDSISQTFIVMQICMALQLGYYPIVVMLFWVSATLMFYCAHWQAYVSGMLRFGRFDVIEAQFCIMAICTVTSICGPEVWKNELFGIELKILITALAAVIAVIALYSPLTVVFTGGVGKNGSTVADTSVLFPAVPLAAVVLPPMIIFCKSTSNAFLTHIVLYYIMFGIVSAKITCKLVIGHMTKSELQLSDSIFCGPLALFFNQYFNTAINEYPLLLICLVWCAFCFICQSVLLVKQICNYLKIECFRIPTSKSLRVRK